MCGRYTLVKVDQVTSALPLVEEMTAEARGYCRRPHYNIAPTQNVLTVAALDGKIKGELMRWGLIPSWTDDPKIGSRLINARAEGLESKPSFRSSFKSRRCLIPADGFYEWAKAEALGKAAHRFGRAGQKLPVYLHLKSRDIFAFAGLYSIWKNPEGHPVLSCTIITTEASDFIRPIHHRMPVILEKKDYERWLDPDLKDASELKTLLKSSPSGALAFHLVSQVVNSPFNDEPLCVEPLK